MASAIDGAIPADGSIVQKSDLRTNFATAASEITALQTGKAPVASPTFTGIVTVPSLACTGKIVEDAVDLGTTGAVTVDLSTASVFVLDATGDVTLTFSNSATSGNAHTFVLLFIQDSTARTITWPASVNWPGGTAPTLTATSGGRDWFSFITVDGGTNWDANVINQNYS